MLTNEREAKLTAPITDLMENERMHRMDPVAWGDKVNKSLKEIMREGVETYDLVTRKALELYNREDAGNGNTNTLRKLLDTLAKVTSLKINACTEIMKITADIGKDERTMQEKIALIKGVVESPFAKMVLDRAEKMKPEKDGDDE